MCINSYASKNPTAVASIAIELAIKCPPTLEVTEEIIHIGEKSKSALKIDNDALSNSCEGKLRLLEEKLNNLILNLCEKHQICSFVSYFLRSFELA